MMAIVENNNIKLKIVLINNYWHIMLVDIGSI